MSAVFETVPGTQIPRDARALLWRMSIATAIFAVGGPFYLFYALLLCWSEPLPIPCEVTAVVPPLIAVLFLAMRFGRLHFAIHSAGVHLAAVDAIEKFSRAGGFPFKDALDEHAYHLHHGFRRLEGRVRLDFRASFILLSILWGSVCGLLAAIAEEESVLYGFGVGALTAILLVFLGGVFLGYAASVTARGTGAPPMTTT